MRQIESKRWVGFTLIELLIVVAIIAILAAIAVPNFLESQVRAKVSRCKADQRTLATGLEAYRVDWNVYVKDSMAPLDVTNVTLNYGEKANGLLQLTTPVAYITTLLRDVFDPNSNASGAAAAPGYRFGSGDWSYAVDPPIDPQDSAATMALRGPISAYVIVGTGPDRGRNGSSYKTFPWKPVGTADADAHPGRASFYLDYDPTNGTISQGDIQRFGGDYMEGDWDRLAPGAGPSGPAVK